MSEIGPVLRRYPLECRRAQIEPLGSAGGMSGARFWRIAVPHAAGGAAGSRTLLLRRWPVKHPSAQRLRLIHAVLEHVAQHGIAIGLPVPIRTRDGHSFAEHAGHLWELTPWLPGTADYECSPSEEKLCAAMRALGQFHVAAADFAHITQLAATRQVAGAVPAVTRRLQRLDELSRGGIGELSRAISDTAWPELAPLARGFVALLPRAAARAIGQLEPLAGALLPLQVCIRDIWHDHVLYSGERVTGLIDFGALDIDTPATDIARLLGSLAGDDAAGWQTGLAAYSAVRPLSPDELLAAKALDISGTILAGCNWLRWIYVEGREFGDHEPIVERFARILSRLTAP